MIAISTGHRYFTRSLGGAAGTEIKTAPPTQKKTKGATPTHPVATMVFQGVPVRLDLKRGNCSAQAMYFAELSHLIGNTGTAVFFE